MIYFDQANGAGFDEATHEPVYGTVYTKPGTGLLGNSLPGSWRPYATTSSWNNTITNWDQPVTTATSEAGTKNLVFVAGNHAGTYPLYNETNVTVSATGSSGANTVVVSSATGIKLYMSVQGTGISTLNTYVTDINVTTITLSNNNTGAVSGNLVFSYGSKHFITNVFNAEADNIRFINTFNFPIWVIDARNITPLMVSSRSAHYTWRTVADASLPESDPNHWLQTGKPTYKYQIHNVPLTTAMYGEGTADGHLIVVDPFLMIAWEMSGFHWADNGDPECSTFNIWDLYGGRSAGQVSNLLSGAYTGFSIKLHPSDIGQGIAIPEYSTNWTTRGGRGSGIPELAGIIRPEEIAAGVINHALVVMFTKNRRGRRYYYLVYTSTGSIVDGTVYYTEPTPPTGQSVITDYEQIFIGNNTTPLIGVACRSDGEFYTDTSHNAEYYPIEGMRLQLDPVYTDTDFDSWGLTREGRIIAIALQKYGMFLVDNGGAMSMAVQLLAKNSQDNLDQWEKYYPMLYRSFQSILTANFRVVDFGGIISHEVPR